MVDDLNRNCKSKNFYENSKNSAKSSNKLFNNKNNNLRHTVDESTHELNNNKNHNIDSSQSNSKANTTSSKINDYSMNKVANNLTENFFKFSLNSSDETIATTTTNTTAAAAVTERANMLNSKTSHSLKNHKTNHNNNHSNSNQNNLANISLSPNPDTQKTISYWSSNVSLRSNNTTDKTTNRKLLDKSSSNIITYNSYNAGARPLTARSLPSKVQNEENDKTNPNK